jgi:hypothetical protein
MQPFVGIPKDFEALTMPCPECSYRSVALLTIPHLLDAHNYSARMALESLQSWMDDYDQDPWGRPIERCDEHGIYLAKYTCPGCLEEDRNRDRDIY